MKRMLHGVGNRLSHDGGVGFVVARALADSDWIAIDRGAALENVAGIVSRERPDLPVIVDAANMNQASGASRRLLAGRQRLHADRQARVAPFVCWSRTSNPLQGRPS